MMPERYLYWPDKNEAAKRIGVSVKTLERMAGRKEIEQRFRTRPGASDIAVFNPKDVEREASKRAAVREEPFILPAEQQEEPLPVLLTGNRPELLEALFRMIVRAMNEPRPESPHLITLEDVLKLGYTRDWIRKQRKMGLLTRFGRKYSRFELERLAGRSDRLDTVQTPQLPGK